MRFHCKKKKALFGAKDSATKHFRKVSGPQCLSGRKTNDVNCRKLAQNNYKSHPSCIFMNPKLYNFRWLWSFHIVVGKRRSGTEKKKSCYILGDVYRSGFAFKTQRKKTTTFLCSYLLVLTFSVSFENKITKFYK